MERQPVGSLSASVDWIKNLKLFQDLLTLLNTVRMEGRNLLFKNVYPTSPAVASVIKDTEDEDNITDDSIVFEEECNMTPDETAGHVM